jgi:hypothetical protein
MIKATCPAVVINATRHQTRVLATRRVICAAKKESGSEITLNSALVPGMLYKIVTNSPIISHWF